MPIVNGIKTEMMLYTYVHIGNSCIIIYMHSNITHHERKLLYHMSRDVYDTILFPMTITRMSELHYQVLYT
jgi:hypothetical protein